MQKIDGLMKIDVNYVLHLCEEMNKINSVPLHEIELYDGEKKIDINQEIIEEWKFVGLSNFCFIEMGIYEAGIKD